MSAQNGNLFDLPKSSEMLTVHPKKLFISILSAQKDTPPAYFDMKLNVK